VIIFALGFFLNSFLYLIDGSLFRDGFSAWFHNYATTVRVPGVLQRIAVCYFIATMIFLGTGIRGQIIWIAALLAGYWVLMIVGPWFGWGTGGLEPHGNFSEYIDNLCAPFASPDTAPFFGFLASPKNASLMWALMYVIGLYLIAYGMYRRKWFLKS